MLRGKGDLSGDQCDRELCRASFFFFSDFRVAIFSKSTCPQCGQRANSRLAEIR
jgi:hypothetical protein